MRGLRNPKDDESRRHFAKALKDQCFQRWFIHFTCFLQCPSFGHSQLQADWSDGHLATVIIPARRWIFFHMFITYMSEVREWKKLWADSSALFLYLGVFTRFSKVSQLWQLTAPTRVIRWTFSDRHYSRKTISFLFIC